MKKGRVLFLGSLLVLVSILAPIFCTGATKLVVWESSGPEEKFVKELGAIYTKETGIEIEVFPIDQLSQGDKLALDGPAGKGADVVVWPHDRIGQSVEQGILWEFPESKIDLNEYTKSAVDAMRYQGKLYGIPYAMESVALVYNKDLIPEVPETFDELIAIAKKINNPKKNKYGFMFDLTDFYFAYVFFGGFDSYVFKETKKGLDVDDIGLANAGGIKAAQYLKSFRDSGLVPEGTSKDVINGLFADGNLAAQINGPWAYPQYEEAGVNYGIAPLPKLSNGKYPQTFIGVKGYYISAFSKNKEEALKFIQWLTTKENSFKHYKSSSIIPARDDVVKMPEFQDNLAFKAFAIQASRGVPMPNVPEMMQVWDPAANAITFILQGQAPADVVLPICVDQIKENIKMMKQ
jgi:arabinogalactan oligomer/maltooligosaccharide transport system substrate-binding protein